MAGWITLRLRMLAAVAKLRAQRRSDIAVRTVKAYRAWSKRNKRG